MVIFVLVILIEMIVWLLLLALHAVRLTPSGISGYELERRAQAGDEQAAFLQRRNAVLPDVAALRFGLHTLLSVLFILTAHSVFGWIALLPSLVALLLVRLGARVPWLARTARQLYEDHETRIMTRAERWHKLLTPLRDTAVHSQEQFIYSKSELVERLKTTRGIISKDELSHIQHALAFSDKTVRDAMTPRSAIDAVEAGDALGPVTLDQLHTSGHSRFPVYDQDIDHVTGILYLHDLVPLKKHVNYARDAMHNQVFYIHEADGLERALAAFLRNRHHVLVVVNAYRETVGLLSLEDVIEALLGRKIVDEFDQHDDLRTVAKRNPRHNNLPKEHQDV